jgi:hypothetical protein
MGTKIPTPYAAVINKNTGGISNTYIVDGCWKFMGCTLLSVNMSLGFNSTASSCSVTLVEDKQAGDQFIEPLMPSLWSLSLPRGGVGAPIFYQNGYALDQVGFNGDNVPFYFCGICTNYSQSKIDANGKLITVSINDIRDLLGGVQCLLGGFALSQNIGNGSPRYASVDNVIDVFGYHNYGMDSNKNEFGMPWYKIQEAIEASRIRLHDMYLEFRFTGDTFNDCPPFYRLSDQITDINSLCTRVCQDAGSDMVCIARKTGTHEALVEIRAIRRTNANILSKVELANFVANRSSIIESCKLGREHRNEPNSSVIIGGMQNSNYVAWPSAYDQSIHLTNNKEDYNAFPSDIKVRLFGGEATLPKVNSDGTITTTTRTLDIESGAIYPFWGFTPDDHAYPLIEPFLSLDHLVFDKNSDFYAQTTQRIPLCLLAVKDFTVRAYPHLDVFLDGDGDSDSRPFAYIADIILNIQSRIPGYVRGLPLNTEVLRAATTTDSYQAFWNLYRLHYPDIAEALGCPSHDFKLLDQIVNWDVSLTDLINFPIEQYMMSNFGLDRQAALDRAINGKISKTDVNWTTIGQYINNTANALNKFLHVVYELIRQYALDNMGRKFLVCLPYSNIMHRIWNGESVPTRPEKPEIEYVVDQRGFWDSVPLEFNGINNEGLASDEENQIRRKFMAEDGRFYPMAVMDWKPTGNINFNSNGITQAMFQELPTSEFRPNRIAEHNPNYVFISCSVNQLSRRPDLALVELPSSINFDPTDSKIKDKVAEDLLDDEFLATKSSIFNYFWYHYQKNISLRDALSVVRDRGAFAPLDEYATRVFKAWTDRLTTILSAPFQYSHSSEKIMDLKCVIIPLTSTWVAYGPWYATYEDAQGMVNVEIDESLVPWNFTTPQDVDQNLADEFDDGLTPLERLDVAGLERFERSVADIDYLDSASIVVAGMPEFGPAQNLGYNNNLTNINVDFGVGGVKTTYNFSTYGARPGTYRKADYDNISRLRIDTRQQLTPTENLNVIHTVANGTNRFRE